MMVSPPIGLNQRTHRAASADFFNTIAPIRSLLLRDRTELAASFAPIVQPAPFGFRRYHRVAVSITLCLPNARKPNLAARKSLSLSGRIKTFFCEVGDFLGTLYNHLPQARIGFDALVNALPADRQTGRFGQRARQRLVAGIALQGVRDLLLTKSSLSLHCVLLGAREPPNSSVFNPPRS